MKYTQNDEKDVALADASTLCLWQSPMPRSNYVQGFVHCDVATTLTLQVARPATTPTTVAPGTVVLTSALTTDWITIATPQAIAADTPQPFELECLGSGVYRLLLGNASGGAAVAQYSVSVRQ